MSCSYLEVCPQKEPPCLSGLVLRLLYLQMCTVVRSLQQPPWWSSLPGLSVITLTVSALYMRTGVPRCTAGLSPHLHVAFLVVQLWNTLHSQLQRVMALGDRFPCTHIPVMGHFIPSAAVLPPGLYHHYLLMGLPTPPTLLQPSSQHGDD